jgi:hypothetical protein
MNPFFSKRKTKTMSQNLNHYHNYYRFLFKTACDTIFPGSPNFLNFELMALLAKQFGPNLSIDSDKLKPQRNAEGNKS